MDLRLPEQIQWNDFCNRRNKHTEDPRLQKAILPQVHGAAYHGISFLPKVTDHTVADAIMLCVLPN